MIFDDARGLIGGQLVKVAGATAGQITNVTVTPDFKAKIEGTIDSKFMPLHRDATCTIRPEGLIAENYVDCNPGTLGSPALQSRTASRRRSGHPDHRASQPPRPVQHLQPADPSAVHRDHRRAGHRHRRRGADFNDILRRANPTLAEARKVIGILGSQQQQLAQAVDATSTIATQAAGHTASLQHFLDQAARLTTLTADHSGNSVSRSPGCPSCWTSPSHRSPSSTPWPSRAHRWSRNCTGRCRRCSRSSTISARSPPPPVRR